MGTHADRAAIQYALSQYLVTGVGIETGLLLAATNAHHPAVSQAVVEAQAVVAHEVNAEEVSYAFGFRAINVAKAVDDTEG